MYCANVCMLYEHFRRFTIICVFYLSLSSITILQNLSQLNVFGNVLNNLAFVQRNNSKLINKCEI